MTDPIRPVLPVRPRGLSRHAIDSSAPSTDDARRCGRAKGAALLLVAMLAGCATTGPTEPSGPAPAPVPAAPPLPPPEARPVVPPLPTAAPRPPVRTACPQPRTPRPASILQPEGSLRELDALVMSEENRAFGFFRCEQRVILDISQGDADKVAFAIDGKVHTLSVRNPARWAEGRMQLSYKVVKPLGRLPLPALLADVPPPAGQVCFTRRQQVRVRITDGTRVLVDDLLEHRAMDCAPVRGGGKRR